MMVPVILRVWLVCVWIWDVGQLPPVPLLSVWLMRRALQLVNFHTYSYFIKDTEREELWRECVLLALSDLWLFSAYEIGRKARTSLLNVNYFWLWGLKGLFPVFHSFISEFVKVFSIMLSFCGKVILQNACNYLKKHHIKSHICHRGVPVSSPQTRSTHFGCCQPRTNKIPQPKVVTTDVTTTRNSPVTHRYSPQILSTVSLFG